MRENNQRSAPNFFTKAIGDGFNDLLVQVIHPVSIQTVHIEEDVYRSVQKEAARRHTQPEGKVTTANMTSLEPERGFARQGKVQTNRLMISRV